MARDALAKLTVKLEAESAQLRAELEKTNRKLDNFGRRAGRTLNSFSRAAKAAFAAISATVVANLGRNALQAADEIAKLSDAVGLSTNALQEYQFAASQSGVSQNILNTALTAFVKRVGEAKAGVGPLVSGLKNVDQTLLESITSAKNQEEALQRVFDAISNATTATDKARIANAAFSRSGVIMVNFVRDGAEALKELRAQAVDLGLIIPEDLLRKAEGVNDQFDIMARVIRTQVTTALLQNAPEIQKLVLALSSLVGYLGDASEGAVRFGRSVVALGASIKEFFSGNFGESAAALEEAWNQLSGNTEEYRQYVIAADKATAAFLKNSESGIKNVKIPTIDIAAPVIDLEAKLPREDREAIDKEKADLREIAQIMEQTRTPAEVLFDRLEELQRLEGAGLPLEASARAAAEAFEQYDSAVAESVDTTKELNGAAVDMGFAFSSAFEEAILSGDKLSDVLKGLLRDITQITIRNAVTAPLGTAIGTGISGFLPFGGQAAAGTSFAPGGVTRVGEYGPEDVYLPRGARVSAANQSGGNVTVNIQNNSSTPVQQSDVRVDRRGMRDTVVSMVIEDFQSGGPTRRLFAGAQPIGAR